MSNTTENQQNNDVLEKGETAAPVKPGEQFKRDLRFFLVKLLIAVVTAWALFSFLFGICVISGEDMYPRLRDGDLALYYRLDKGSDIGDVVTYRIDGERFYGRVVASGGDIVDMTESGLLVVNGNIQQEQTFYETYWSPENTTASAVTVPQGSVFVLGDFRPSARDSREFGSLSQDKIDGQIISILRRRGL